MKTMKIRTAQCLIFTTMLASVFCGCLSPKYRAKSKSYPHEKQQQKT